MHKLVVGRGSEGCDFVNSTCFVRTWLTHSNLTWLTHSNLTWLTHSNLNYSLTRVNVAAHERSHLDGRWDRTETPTPRIQC